MKTSQSIRILLLTISIFSVKTAFTQTKLDIDGKFQVENNGDVIISNLAGSGVRNILIDNVGKIIPEASLSYSSFDASKYYSSIGGFTFTDQGNYVFAGAGVGSEIRMNLQFPHGSKPSKIRISYWDASTSDYEFFFIKGSINSNQGVAGYTSIGSTNINEVGWKYIEFDFPTEVIDNQVFVYMLGIKPPTGSTYDGSNARFGPVSVSYER